MINLFMKNKKGFTLVELMVVVVIIGILVAIAVPVYNGAQDAAKKGAGDSNCKVLNDGILQYYAANNSYPTEAQLLTFLSKDAADFKYVGGGAAAGALAEDTYVTNIANKGGIRTP